MTPKYTTEEFLAAKSREKLPLECEHCHKTFYIQKRYIVDLLNGTIYAGRLKYCSRTCKYDVQNKGQNKQIYCLQCGKLFYKYESHINKIKSGHHFCSLSCAGTYNNTHKTKGSRRSKLEVFLEQELTRLYPQLEVHYNRKDAINSELDIYVPSLNLAIELNGIFHYEPIYGMEQLHRKQNNDNRKIQACIEKNIEFCIIDVSSLSYFKEERAIKYLNIVTDIINNKIK